MKPKRRTLIMAPGMIFDTLEPGERIERIETVVPYDEALTVAEKLGTTEGIRLEWNCP